MKPWRHLCRAQERDLAGAAVRGDGAPGAASYGRGSTRAATGGRELHRRRHGQLRMSRGRHGRELRRAGSPRAPPGGRDFRWRRRRTAVREPGPTQPRAPSNRLRSGDEPVRGSHGGPDRAAALLFLSCVRFFAGAGLRGRARGNRAPRPQRAGTGQPRRAGHVRGGRARLRAGGARELGWRRWGGKGKAHRIHGNDQRLPQRARRWFLRHRLKRRRGVYLRHRFMRFLSLFSINTVSHQRKSINR